MNLNAFPEYTEFPTKVPVRCVTPKEGRIFHRFFDTSPFNPSNTRMALLRVPFEDRRPEPGDIADIVIVNLEDGTESTVAQTAGWEFQMGANIAWISDTKLIFNNVDTETWTPYAETLDIISGERVKLDGTVYHLSPDGTRALSSDMGAMRRTQGGYGVILPDKYVRRNVRLSDEDGLFITDTRTGDRKMVISLRDVVERTRPPKERAAFDDKEVYGFHCKWNPQGSRLIFTVRWFPADHPNRYHAQHDRVCEYDVYTMREDGSELFNAVPAYQWRKGGHHINWFPDGEHLSMNLKIDETEMRFVQVRYDGSGLKKIDDDAIGSGHPTVHPNGRHILTDTYVHEKLAYGDGTTPIRLFDRLTGKTEDIIRIQTMTPFQSSYPDLRLDPHPAWDRSWRYVAFNGFAGGTRRVYVADLSAIV